MNFGQSAMTAVAIVLAVAGLAAPAPAASQSTAWATYMRAGPAETAAVIDEIPQATVIAVSGCSNRWCQVQYGGVTGYIDQDALTLARLPPGAAPVGGPQGCFWSDQSNYQGSEPARFCQTHPAH